MRRPAALKHNQLGLKCCVDARYSTCPGWRNQSRVPVNARTCKHLRSILGDKYEDARLKLKNPDGDKATAGKKKASASKSSASNSKATWKRKTRNDDDDDDNIASPSKRKTAAKEPASKEKDPEEEEEDEEEDEDKPPSKAMKFPAGDELEEIDGIKPKQVIKDGDEVEAPSKTSDAVYKVKRTWDHYYCTCPAWRNQSRNPVNARTCKHLRSILGDKYEDARLKLKNPDGNNAPAGKKKASATDSKATGKRKARDDDDDDDDIASPNKRKRGGKKPASKGKDDEEEEDNEEDEEDEAPSKARKIPGVLLAVKWDLEKGADPTGWWVSEKLDGVRTFYDGQTMMSRLGNPFTPPKWFIEKLPKGITLDGELFGGRGTFQSTVSIVKTMNSPHWQNITFQIFDIPSMKDEPFEARMACLNHMFGPSGEHKQDHVFVLEQTEAKSRDHVLEMLKDIEAKGGEGLMLRKPKSLYEPTRSNTLQKIKTFFDAEAKVTGHVPGKGKNKGVMGALKCVMASGKTFNVGSGFTDKQRGKPPKTGSIITYRFQELTSSGVPRFPTFVGEAIDKDEPKDAEVPHHKKDSKGKAGDE
ncbi:DNA ligase/mRNA capping enzyme [Rickenella mellea]|uniref:DNA ligase/mRNA capping enzyme n=1 Tax=Rickenella mellea TaxID=50990 RepID=A0A4Y7PTK2_9AGAM|nr:DNA ligase/mRNA capping enzyme [Rickenella mellea]